VSDLKGVIYHDDRKPLERWLQSQVKYASQEAAHLLQAPVESLSKVDRIRLMGWPAPFLVFFYVLIVKRALLDGRAGWLYAFQRVLAEILLALELLDQRMSGGMRLVFSPHSKLGGGGLEIERSTHVEGIEALGSSEGPAEQKPLQSAGLTIRPAWTSRWR